MQTENQIQNVEREEEKQIAELEQKIRELKDKMRKEDTERKTKEYVEHFLSRLSKNCEYDVWLCQCKEKCMNKCLTTTKEELVEGNEQSKKDTREYSVEEKGKICDEIKNLLTCVESVEPSYQKAVGVVMIYRLLNKNKWFMRTHQKFHKTAIDKCFEFMENPFYKEIAYVIGRTFFEEFNDPSVNVITKPIPNPPENTLSQPEPKKEESKQCNQSLVCKQGKQSLQSIHCMVTRKRKMMETQNEEQLAKRQCV